MAHSESKKTREIALCGVLGALAAVLIMLGGFIPIATYCCPVLASLVLLPALEECGPGMSVGLYAVIGILSLLVAPDKEAAVLFVFIGYYPILKPFLDRLHRVLIRWCCKFLVFDTAIALTYWLLLRVIGIPSLTAEFDEFGAWMLAALVLLGNVTFVLYDMAMARLRWLYRTRLRPQLKKLWP